MSDAYRYIRFSTPRQDRGTTIERQEGATSQLCREEGWTVRDVMIDKGRSAFKGAHTSKGALGRFRKAVEAGDIPKGSRLVVENIDRLSRENPRIARNWIEDITDLGITVEVCQPRITLDAEAMDGRNMGAFLIHTLESKRANSESSRKAEFRPAVIAKQRKKAEEGVAFSACLPGWLEIRDGKVVPREERAEIVRLIYQWALQSGYESIAKRLNERYAPWNGVRWNSNYVRDILHSEKVEGEYRPITGENREQTGEIILNYYPRVVDALAVENARKAIVARRSTGGASFHEAKNLFTGLLYCAECDGRMTRSQHVRKGVTYEYLICRASRVGSCANNTQFRYDVFERAALEQIIRLSVDHTAFTRSDDTAPLRLQLANAEKRLEVLIEKLPRIVRALVALPESESLQNELRDHEADIKDTRFKLLSAEADLAKATGTLSPELLIARLSDLRVAMTSEDEDERVEARRVLRSGIETVVSRVIFDRTIQPFRSRIGERRALMIMRGNHLGFLLDLNDGTLVEKIDYTGWDGSPDKFLAEQSRRMVRLSNDPAASAEALATIKRRADTMQEA